MHKTINLCGRGKCCPKLTLPIIKDKVYDCDDWFFLKDEFGNECKLTITDLYNLKKVIDKL